VLALDWTSSTAGTSLEPGEVRDHLVSLAPRRLVPRYIDMVEGLPRTQAMQRVQKNVLRERGVSETTWDAEGRR
jgi:crotonobetaine/carnitine-CoA ligase